MSPNPLSNLAYMKSLFCLHWHADHVIAELNEALNLECFCEMAEALMNQNHGSAPLSVIIDARAVKYFSSRADLCKLAKIVKPKLMDPKHKYAFLIARSEELQERIELLEFCLKQEGLNTGYFYKAEDARSWLNIRQDRERITA